MKRAFFVALTMVSTLSQASNNQDVAASASDYAKQAVGRHLAQANSPIISGNLAQVEVLIADRICMVTLSRSEGSISGWSEENISCNDIQNTSEETAAASSNFQQNEADRRVLEGSFKRSEGKSY